MVTCRGRIRQSPIAELMGRMMWSQMVLIPGILSMVRKMMLMILSQKLSQVATVIDLAGDMMFMANLRVRGRLEVMRLYPVTVKKKMEI